MNADPVNADPAGKRNQPANNSGLAMFIDACLFYS
jgi:hypothetical protein